MAHSVLFDQDAGYGNSGLPPHAQQTDGFEFYQTQYSDPSAAQANMHGTGDDFYASSYGTAAPLPPLLEELEINFQHIKSKTLAVLNPFKPIDREIYDDADMAGPLLFILVLGTLLLLSGKSQFGYIYGVGLLGTLGIWAILNLMSHGGIEVMRTASILGYCLLPILVLGGLGLTVDLKAAQLAGLAAVVPILWCTYSSATMFVTILSMSEQRLLVAYPVGLFYASFALLTIF
ncbi:Yip1-domain-containing protein [Linderina pennispora]|uniref:Protein YIP n=1 Tax=Linderina pennispora TaxID=61395 RepID=A0A1Y1W0W9_9FUNG|nr:Yip1-domain-containing protein [Linderina pennispora]ORX67173.1 Yip1-domain-containing protein [Linderina pennispora]